ncbi:MAG: hypothetical protein Q9219_001576 [cf. Caloplaca sp. 3 TL-2023]
MSPSPITLAASTVAILSLYTATKSYHAIINLRKYETRSERAAKHSSTAAHELYKTRATQATSAAAIALGLLSSIILLIKTVFNFRLSPGWEVLLPPINISALIAAYIHNRDYWKAKAKVPFVTGFNEGIERSKEVRQMMVPLGLAWGVVGFLQWV